MKQTGVLFLGRGTFLHLPEGEADTGSVDLGTFWEGVKPVCLGFTGHDEEAAVFQLGGDALFGHGVFEMKFSEGSKAEAGDWRIFHDG